MSSKNVDFIKSLFADDRFDMVQIADYSIDRLTLVDVSSVPVSDDEMILIETTEYRIHLFASQIISAGQAREMSRATFDDFMDDDRIDTITIHHDLDSGLKDIVVERGNVVSWKPNPRNHLATLIETEREILEVRWGNVVSLSSTKKPRGRNDAQ